MKRFLIVLIGLIVGGFAAAVSTVEMRHLRGVAMISAWLPGWSAQLSPESGVSRGRVADFARMADGAPLAVAWRYSGISSRGLSYQVNFDGDGVDLSAGVIWPFFARHLEISDAKGEVSAKALGGTQSRLALGGVVLVQSAQGQVRLDRVQIATLSGDAVWRNVTLEGLALGNTTLELRALENGGWVMTTDNPGPPMALRGSASGRFDSALAQVDMTATGADALEAGLRQQLDRAYGQIENGWAIRQEITLPVPQLTVTIDN